MSDKLFTIAEPSSEPDHDTVGALESLRDAACRGEVIGLAAATIRRTTNPDSTCWAGSMPLHKTLGALRVLESELLGWSWLGPILRLRIFGGGVFRRTGADAFDQAHIVLAGAAGTVEADSVTKFRVESEQ